jgi:hypothetical protein
MIAHTGEIDRMHRIPGIPVHACAPKEWRGTQAFTGDFELDASIARCANADVPARLRMYADSGQTAYRAKTGYSGYHGYSGDD